MKIRDIRLALTLAATALLMLSCTERELGDGTRTDKDKGGDKGGGPVSFGLDVDTRGEAKTTLNNGENFGVFAYRLPSPDGGTTPGSITNAIGQYMSDNTRVSKNATTCNYSPIANWPLGTNDYMLFFAYYPFNYNGSEINPTGQGENYRFEYAVTQGVTSAPQMQITYRASNLPGNHIDLMYACTTKYRTEVPILLKHALTCLSFKAILAEPSHDGAVVKVKSLKIKNVINKGTLTVDGNGNSSWALSTLQTDRRDYENITIDALRLINVTLNPNTPVDIIAPVSGNPNNVNFLMIPQPLTDILVEIGLDIDITKPDGSHEFHEEVNFFPVPDSHPWEMGKHITYIIHAARDLIYIGAQDEGWYRNTPDTMWDIEHQ